MSAYVPDQTKRTGKMTPHPKFGGHASVELEEWDIDGHHATLSYIDFDAGDQWPLVIDNLVNHADFLYDDAKKIVITIERTARPQNRRNSAP